MRRTLHVTGMYMRQTLLEESPLETDITSKRNVQGIDNTSERNVQGRVMYKGQKVVS